MATFGIVSLWWVSSLHAPLPSPPVTIVVSGRLVLKRKKAVGCRLVFYMTLQSPDGSVTVRSVHAGRARADDDWVRLDETWMVARLD